MKKFVELKDFVNKARKEGFEICNQIYFVSREEAIHFEYPQVFRHQFFRHSRLSRLEKYTNFPDILLHDFIFQSRLLLLAQTLFMVLHTSLYLKKHQQKFTKNCHNLNSTIQLQYIFEKNHKSIITFRLVVELFSNGH